MNKTIYIVKNPTSILENDEEIDFSLKNVKTFFSKEKMIKYIKEFLKKEYENVPKSYDELIIKHPFLWLTSNWEILEINLETQQQKIYNTVRNFIATEKELFN